MNGASTAEPPQADALWLYHITSWKNLPNILREGGLWCPRELETRGLQPQSIAHDRIKQRRAHKSIPFPPGGTLYDYVPWSFAPRSPMLCAIAHGRLENRTVEQDEIVHLRTSMAAVERGNLSWMFTDGHAAIAFSKFFNNLSDLERVDWELMRARHWANTNEDSDRTRRRQAEFLIHTFAPWSLVNAIGVLTQNTTDEVKNVLGQFSHFQPPVKVVEGWYY